MYRLSDKQIDYIFNDISARGVKLESLQHNLLDHICCIIERELEPDGDFDAFYQTTVRTFYKSELKEIEDETINLLTFKNYYAMKKITVISGAISAVAFIAGSIFKVMYWPWASALLLTAIVIAGFIFLPLMCLLKSKDSPSALDKLTLVFGALVGMLFCVSVLTNVFHWPFGRFFWLSTVSVSIFLFIPAYFYAGIRRTETKVNTILTSVILIGLTGLQFTLINVHGQSPQIQIKYAYLQNDELLRKMQRHITDTATNEKHQMLSAINITCQQIKDLILNDGGNQNNSPKDFEVRVEGLSSGSAGSDFMDNRKGMQLMAQLKNKVTDYNEHSKEENKISINNSVLSIDINQVGFCNNLIMLNGITQIQL